MSDRELMQMALDALGEWQNPGVERIEVAKQALRKRLSQSEPMTDENSFPFVATVLWDHGKEVIRGRMFADQEPSKREWVGLSDKEYEAILKQETYWYAVAKAVEAKLKEKNT